MIVCRHTTLGSDGPEAEIDQRAGLRGAHKIRTMTERFIDSKRPFVIAEIALAHDGSLGMAHAFVDAAAQAGADAVKFQTHIATAESTFDEPFRVAFSRQDLKRYDYWRRTAFTAEQWQELAAHAKQRGVTFLSSPFSVEAVHLLAGLGVSTLEGAIRRGALARFARGHAGDGRTHSRKHGDEPLAGDRCNRCLAAFASG